MYSNKFRNQGRRIWSLLTLEKALYAALVPGSFGYFGYRLYKQNVIEMEQRAIELKEMEEKYINNARNNLKMINQEL